MIREADVSFIPAAILLCLTCAARIASAQGAVPFSTAALSPKAAKIDTANGTEVVSLGSGGQAVFRDVRLQDGTIDVDVKVTRQRSFVYVRFRVQSDSNHEEFYLRPHKSGLPDALQYGPVTQGRVNWQLYYGPRGAVPAEIPDGVWNHLRIVLRGSRAAFFLGDTTKPVMLVDRLARAPTPGYLALSAFTGPSALDGRVVAEFSNLRVRAGDTPFAFPPVARDSLIAGGVREWSIGVPFAAPDSAIWTIDSAWTKRWTVASADSSGLTDLARFVRLPPTNGYVGAIARLRLVAPADGLYRFDLGFSDRATVFLNGRPLMYEDKSYDFLNRRDGLIRPDELSLMLPLRRGANELQVLVADRFGGWAIMGRFPDTRGLRIEP